MDGKEWGRLSACRFDDRHFFSRVPHAVLPEPRSHQERVCVLTGATAKPSDLLLHPRLSSHHRRGWPQLYVFFSDGFRNGWGEALPNN